MRTTFLLIFHLLSHGREGQGDNLEDYDYGLPNSSVKLSSGPWLTAAGTARTSTQLAGHPSTRNDDCMAATHPLRPPVQFPWMQGLLRHSFTCEKQLGWWGPSGHKQRKPFTSLMHVAPLRQGLEAHSSMSMLHLCPVEKGGSSLSNPKRLGNRHRTETYCVDTFICTGAQRNSFKVWDTQKHVVPLEGGAVSIVFWYGAKLSKCWCHVLTYISSSLHLGKGATSQGFRKRTSTLPKFLMLLWVLPKKLILLLFSAGLPKIHCFRLVNLLLFYRR